jgi:hypothetical protein
MFDLCHQKLYMFHRASLVKLHEGVSHRSQLGRQVLGNKTIQTDMRQEHKLTQPIQSMSYCWWSQLLGKPHSSMQQKRVAETIERAQARGLKTVRQSVSVSIAWMHAWA